jgi:cytoskeletal protein RodZ
MSPTREQRRFRVNPVELVVFAAVTLVFANSVYQLFYDWDEIRAKSGTVEEASNASNASRGIASTTPLFSSIEVKCNEDAAKKKTSEARLEKTDAAKIRLSGPLCSPTAAAADTKHATLIKTEVMNKTTNAAATVITNTTEGRFSTDFIPLNPGPNQIQLKWVYSGGKELSQDLIIQKN